MSGIGFNESVDLKNGEGFCGRPKEEGFREHQETHRHCYNDGFTGVYELAQKYGFTGTEQEFLASLKGVKGDGVYVDHIDQSDEAGEVSTIWFTDGSSMRLINGIPGYTPVKGVDYFDGAKGDPGYTPIKGVDYFDGAKGDPGYTPVKGTDYFTATEKAEIIEEVLAEMPDDTVEWKSIVGKPFRNLGGDTLAWDGNTAGMVSADGMFYKVSDEIPTRDDLANGGVVRQMYEGEEIVLIEFSATDLGYFESGAIFESSSSFWIVNEASVGIVLVGSLAFPSPGVYFYAEGGLFTSSLRIAGYAGFGEEILNEDALPKNVPVINSASAGQFVTVAEVDDDGVPVKYAAVTVPDAEGVGF